MKRGDIWLVDFDPTLGSEIRKRRPAVIVSNDAANRTAERLKRGVITVVPVTTNLSRIYPFQVKLLAEHTGLRQDSKALAEQVRAVAFQRLSTHIATLPADLLVQLDGALRLHLGL